MKILHEKQPVHIVQKELLNPSNPIIVNLVGAGGTGSQVLTALGRMNYSLIALGHAGLMVRVLDDDIVSTANLGRQLFTTAEKGLPKSVVLINRLNRFFGTDWKAIEERFDTTTIKECPELSMAAITVSCVDTVASRFEIEKILTAAARRSSYYNNSPCYWMDFGNSKDTGQVILSTIQSIKQPASKKFKTIASLPAVTKGFRELLMQSEQKDDTPSCSLAEALQRQDLFINSTLANLGASLLWQMFSQGMLFNRGLFLNLKDFRTQPLKVG